MRGHLSGPTIGRRWRGAAVLGAVIGLGIPGVAVANSTGHRHRPQSTSHTHGWRAARLKGHADGDAGSNAAAVNAFLHYSRPATYSVHYTPNVLVPMRDGYRLTCDLYQPAVANGSVAPGRFPGLVINYDGYGRTYFPYGDDLQNFAGYGYNVAWCNTRGSQGNAGLSPAPNSLGPVFPWQPQEQQDDYDLIEWMAHQAWSTGKIGQVGTSYGGISTWLVAGRQAPPNLDAIIPIMGTTNLYTQFAYPGGIRTGPGDARGHWTQGCSTQTGEPTCGTRVTAEWAANPNYDLFWKQQTVDPGSIKIATLDIDGWQDFFAPEIDAAYAGMASHSNFRLLVGPWTHTIPDNPQDNHTELLSTGVSLAWFDRWLRGDRSAPLPPKVTAYEMAAGSAQPGWQGLNAWPAPGSQATQFDLAPGGGLQADNGGGSKAAEGTDSYTVAPDGSSGSLTYSTAPLEGARRVITGPVDVTLNTAFSAWDGDIIVSLAEVAPDGTVTPISGPPSVVTDDAGELKASHRDSDSDPLPVVPGKAYDLHVQIHSQYWEIAKGDRLQLTVTSAGANVVHDAPAGTVTIASGAGTASTVDLNLGKAQAN